MKRIIALSLCILTLFLCACQPTPDEEPVPNKGDDVMGEKIHTTPIPKTPSPTSEAEPGVTEAPFVIPHIDVPEHWYEEIQLKCGTKVIIDADIEYTDAAHPVYIIKDAVRFDGAILKKLIDYFAKDPKWRQEGSTREELLERLEAVLRGNVYTDDNGNEIREPYENEDELIAELMKQLQEVDPDTHWEEIKSADDIPHGASVISDGTREHHIYQEGTAFWIKSYGRDIISQSELMILQSGDELPIPSMTEQEAVSLAEKVLEDVGLNEHLSVNSSQVERRLDEKGNVIGTGWRITCTLKVDNAVTLDEKTYSFDGQCINSALTGDENIGFRPNRKMESFTLTFEDGVLVMVTWNDPQEIVSVENPAVELLPFDKIKERIVDRIKYGLSYRDDEGYEDVVMINRIFLAYVKAEKANELYEYYFAPMWCFTDELTDLSIPCRLGALFINAIDGTFVRFTDY